MSIYRDITMDEFVDDAPILTDEDMAEMAEEYDIMRANGNDPWEGLAEPFDPDAMPFGTDFSSEPPF